MYKWAYRHIAEVPDCTISVMAVTFIQHEHISLYWVRTVRVCRSRQHTLEMWASCSSKKAKKEEKKSGKKKHVDDVNRLNMLRSAVGRRMLCGSIGKVQNSCQRWRPSRYYCIVYKWAWNIGKITFLSKCVRKMIGFLFPWSSTLQMVGRSIPRFSVAPQIIQFSITFHKLLYRNYYIFSFLFFFQLFKYTKVHILYSNQINFSLFYYFKL